MILSFAPDLIARSKIDLAARHYAVPVRHVETAEAFSSALEELPGIQLIIIDADYEGIDAPALIRLARERVPGARVVAFCSHVLGELIQAARDAGAHSVMANSTFTAAVPGLVAPLATPTPEG